jgi:glycosyltransferase involved in cell wall biosynthesis
VIISLIIPAYNEADCIEANLIELEDYLLQSLNDYRWDTIIINDGSSDDTAHILEKLQKSKNWLKVINLPFHYGRGAALRAGFEMATGDVIVTLDADFSYAPYHIKRLVSKLLEEQADIVLASAYRKDGSVKNVPPKRLLISKIGNKILSYMFGSDITVLTCIVRAYEREFIKSLDLHSADKEIHLEILSKAKVLGAKIVEVPADLYWRPEKLQKKQEKGQANRRSTLKIRKTSNTHLFFALLSKPGFIFWIPGYILTAISFIIFLLTLRTIILDLSVGTSLYHSIRNSMITASISWVSMGFSFLLGIQFFTLGFLTNQSKANQEETYRTLHSIYTELKTNKKD